MARGQRFVPSSLYHQIYPTLPASHFCCSAPRCLNCLSALVQPTTFLLMFLASGINPLLYAFLSQRFRAAIRDTFSFRKGREQVRLGSARLKSISLS